MECRVPLPSTPDVFDIYPSIGPIAPTSTTPITTTTTPPPPTTTSLQISQECSFSESDDGAIFDTGEPYSNNVREG